jgi:hypothetical protein
VPRPHSSLEHCAGISASLIFQTAGKGSGKHAFRPYTHLPSLAVQMIEDDMLWPRQYSLLGMGTRPQSVV